MDYRKNSMYDMYATPPMTITNNNKSITNGGGKFYNSFRNRNQKNPNRNTFNVMFKGDHVDEESKELSEQDIDFNKNSDLDGILSDMYTDLKYKGNNGSHTSFTKPNTEKSFSLPKMCHCLNKTSLAVDELSIKKYYNQKKFEIAENIRKPLIKNSRENSPIPGTNSTTNKYLNESGQEDSSMPFNNSILDNSNAKEFVKQTMTSRLGMSSDKAVYRHLSGRKYLSAMLRDPLRDIKGSRKIGEDANSVFKQFNDIIDYKYISPYDLHK